MHTSIERHFDGIQMINICKRSYITHQVGYEPYFGKTVYPEPKRCRRTDDKKWRCSNEAAPVSKYCERQMHRAHNRSRKHVKK
ncbi:growth-regulating factor 4-like isoform X2 [Zea mays]|uniref:growth-regulating factor 4-like isoform X2 n=1 Tax=Zea mays TaxID=4577 RepID=UPI0004DEB0BB|nr:growth-regulating factor 4-like isoform X2 [Zea mays]|eukprot:XP_008652137.1 growth-regulating factor 4-like isoform X2 [Zea mays]